MWRVIYIAPNATLAEEIRKSLVSEGFLVSVRPAGVGDGGAGLYEVLVPQSEAQDAYEAITALLSTRSGLVTPE